MAKKNLKFKIQFEKREKKEKRKKIKRNKEERIKK